MLQFIKKNYKVPLAIICILILLWVHQYKKANEIDLTNLSTLNQICELLNLPMDVVFPEGATEHHFSKDVRNGRGIYTVLFRPYVHTKDDYDAWMTHLKDTSKQISTDGILVKQSLELGKLALEQSHKAETAAEAVNWGNQATDWFGKAEKQNHACFEKEVYDLLRKYRRQNDD